MIITFNTQNEVEVSEVVQYLENIGMVRANETEHVTRVTETVVEATKNEKPTPTIPEEKKTVDLSKKASKPKAEKTSVIGLDELKELAKKKVEEIGREGVKELISKYADKLAEVPESDYAELAKALS